MNKYGCDILLSLAENPISTQRDLSIRCGISLRTVNRSLKALRGENLLDKNNKLTAKAFALIENRKPSRAIILAAGYGMRMVPINIETPKALLTIRGEVLIERLIKHLHEVNIREIYVVVGFMKERFEYLRDTFGVHLIYNSEYSLKNNLYSVSLALDFLSNAYVIPCDLWCEENPFHHYELYSWYMVSDAMHKDSSVIANRHHRLVKTKTSGNRMIGISYLTVPESEIVRSNISRMCVQRLFDNDFWESALYLKDRMVLYARVVSDKKVIEINTYEQLRTFDSDSDNLKSDAITTIMKALSIGEKEITNITVLKKGMTNRSFLFQHGSKKYIMRIPGEGTDKLINRQQEYAVYSVLNGKGICDNVVYINPENGYKITEFLDGARVCDPYCPEDVQKAMAKLRSFHEEAIVVDHTFDIFDQIQYYENLRNGVPSEYKDYPLIKEQVFALRAFIDSLSPTYCLSHIDAVADNFLFVPKAQSEEIRLIDWEYAGMQDPHVDIAMFCIYAMYDRSHIEALINTYFSEGCSRATRAKIYCYIAACGLLWSNWCEYKRSLGVEFGEYSLQQYIYAKEYSKVAKVAIQEL